MGQDLAPLSSACVFCGSSDAADPQLLADAADLGRALAASGLEMIYGGGGVGLMGACAIAAHEAGGKVLGVIPHFLKERERRLDVVETIVVASMHERKMIMFERSDSFIVLPGGVGTLEEIVELLSWRRLDLHAKPVVFYSPGGFWEPLYALFQHTVDAKLTPPEFMDSWISVDRVADIIPALSGVRPAEPIPESVVLRMT
ncbi:TIGR00730 family Rossman fold protein [Phenylobacterium sp.]|uniref:LOG family protein n=1 Tax=Phenylobacterium sp. TaxID=1871053 RepID=UPI0027275FB1|nr:TIGR00730 family Rossman fold protein [Phenylobacterium sp.]MDO8377982.1 TIGR00730 family Rossman fold protein [Phenylobacterium sp.]